MYSVEDDYSCFANALRETLEKQDEVIVSSTELNISKEEVHDVLQDQFSSFIGNTQGQCVRV